MALLPLLSLSIALLAGTSPAEPSAAPDPALRPVLITLAEQADLSGAANLRTKREKGRYVVDALREVASRTQGRVLSTLEAAGVEYRSYYITNLVWAEVRPELAGQLAALPEVARIEDSPQGSMARPVDPESEPETSKLGVEWNLTKVRAPEAWEMGITGEGAVVGGVDTGVQWHHPALVRQYRGSVGEVPDHNYNWHDAIHITAPGCTGDSPVPCDADGHGTHTVGTMVGDDGGLNQIGVAPDAQWIGCRCWEPVHRTDIVYVIECMEWMMAPTDLAGNNPDPDLAPHVINNSWICEPDEGCTDPNALLAVVQALRAAGIVVVAGAGNSGPSPSTVEFPPAIYAESFSVGATNATDGLTNFSSRGPVTVDGSNRMKPDIVAPGNGVRSANFGNRYATWSGTSMAAPHVAGLVALLVSAVPSLAGNVDEIEDIIRRTSTLASTPNNNVGHGRIDAVLAIQAAQASVGIDPPDDAPLPPVAPGQARLAQNAPNPFNPLTRIEFELPYAGATWLTVFDAAGREVRSLIGGERLSAGPHTMRWDGKDDQDRAVASGVYFYRLRSESFARTRSMALIR